MNKKFTLFLFLSLVLSYSSFAQITISTDSVLQTGTCAGSQVIVRFATKGTFPRFGNTFTAQLSNKWGQFTNPVNIGTTNFNVGLIMATLPKNAQFGFLYRIRVVSNNPAVIGSASPNTVIITSTALTATINTPNGTELCPGDSLTLEAFLPNATYQWSTGAKSQSIKVGQPGSYWVKVTDPLGCNARDTVVVKTKASCLITSISDETQSPSTISVFPNPASASGKIIIKEVPPGYSKAQLIDMQGRNRGTVPVSSQGQVLLPTVLPPGVYLLSLLKKNHVKNIGKLLIQ
ncbi:T9SS type A sorting domain-containing protein [Adhaeribacter aquaticus]|uniref:T9SS type A sorting domain-containing protein n=1 Tax=Adhaeribacter aquaticus TaxID=299567 RepID=UPI0012F9BA98|nr:T9SS type A sorting domain-containing protein [Adhaeribacter aquaticus]